MDDEKLIEQIAALLLGNTLLAEAIIKKVRAAVIDECARVADSGAKDMAGINADRYWQSRRLAHAIRALAAPRVEQEKKP